MDRLQSLLKPSAPSRSLSSPAAIGCSSSSAVPPRAGHLLPPTPILNIDALYPVYPEILDHLCILAPYTCLQLSRYHYHLLSQRAYRHVPVTEDFIRRLAEPPKEEEAVMPAKQQVAVIPPPDPPKQEVTVVTKAPKGPAGWLVRLKIRKPKQRAQPISPPTALTPASPPTPTPTLASVLIPVRPPAPPIPSFLRPIYSIGFTSCAPLELLAKCLCPRGHSPGDDRQCLPVTGPLVHARRIEIGMGVLEEADTWKRVNATSGYRFVLVHMDMHKELEIVFLQGDKAEATPKPSTVSLAQLFVRPSATSSLVRVIFPDSRRIREGPTSKPSLRRWPVKFHTFPVQLIHTLITSEAVDNPHRKLLLYTRPNSITLDRGIKYEFCLRDAGVVKGMMEEAFLTDDPTVVGMPGGRKMMRAAKRFMEEGCRFVELDDRHIRGRTELGAV
ncbi:hypothetical protein IAT38_003592 [Cryptococcus sp. DSM 104549]